MAEDASITILAAQNGPWRMPEGEQLDNSIGPYKLLSVLGEGGFGVVYLAERRTPHVQRVALKIIKPGMDSKAVIARFEQERQALAVMDHPNVAKVYDAGATEKGRPYFVMEHVQGEPITEYCDRHNLTIKQRLELFILVCEAVQHAHMKGVIHRDIKPSNILVTMKDGADGPIPKVIDFGVAKAISHTFTNKTIFTEHGQIIGTPEYMSPEQAEMGALDIDTRTDVYSLGVVLYELLTGLLPFDSRELRSKGYHEIQRIIREVDPPKPSTRLTSVGETGRALAKHRQEALDSLTKTLKRELEWIPLKAMRKDRVRRYGSPKAMAEDVERYLKGEPLAAGPDSAAYLAQKFVQRHRTPLGMATILVVLVVAAGFMYMRQTGEIKTSRALAAQADANERRRAAESEAALRLLATATGLQFGQVVVPNGGTGMAVIPTGLGDQRFLDLIGRCIAAQGVAAVDGAEQAILMHRQIVSECDDLRRQADAESISYPTRAVAEFVQFTSMDYLADLLLRLQRFAEARPFAYEALRIMCRDIGLQPDDAQIVHRVSRLQSILEALSDQRALVRLQARGASFLEHGPIAERVNATLIGVTRQERAILQDSNGLYTASIPELELTRLEWTGPSLPPSHTSTSGDYIAHFDPSRSAVVIQRVLDGTEIGRVSSQSDHILFHAVDDRIAVMTPKGGAGVGAGGGSPSIEIRIVNLTPVGVNVAHTFETPYEFLSRSEFDWAHWTQDTLAIAHVRDRNKEEATTGTLVMDTSNGKTRLLTPSGSCLSVAVSPNGELVALGLAPTGVQIWNSRTGRVVHACDGHSNWVVRLAFNHDGALLASAAGDTTARMWNTQTGAMINAIEFDVRGSQYPQGPIRFAQHDQHLLIGASTWQLPLQ